MSSAAKQFKTDQAGFPIDAIDREIIMRTQGGLPLTAQPYAILAEQIGISEAEVMQRMQHMLEHGIIRRIGAVPNHYKLGYRANGMSVWDVRDDRVLELGERVGQLPFVTHCYQRPRYRPLWPYNLFAMVHAQTRAEALTYVRQIQHLLGAACRAHDVLFSTQILKKTGLRLHRD